MTAKFFVVIRNAILPKVLRNFLSNFNSIRTMENKHPNHPQSNISKFSGYDPDKYVLVNVLPTVLTHECLTPGRPPRLTQITIGKHLMPTTNELSEAAPRPTISELTDAVIENMVKKDKAFWVDRPGANAYTLHDAYYNYGMTTDIVKPARQDVFPRSYQYDLDCVQYRRRHACDGIQQQKVEKQKSLGSHCRDCSSIRKPALSSFELTWEEDQRQKRWRYYPDVTTTLSCQEIRASMANVGRPFQNDACNWYYENYPPVKYDSIIRKFSK